MEENIVVVEQKKRNGKGLASFILGAAGVIIPIAMIIFICDSYWHLNSDDHIIINVGIALGFILFAVGMVFGILGSLKKPRGFAITGIVLSSIALVVSFIAIEVLDFVDMGRAFLLF